MDNSTMLMISYENLKEMLGVMQEDGLSADGCRYDLHEDAAKYIAYEAASGSIATIPAERHGYWEESPTGNKNFNYCSVCGGAIQRYDNVTFTYCPHCGAKMENGIEGRY